jgi:hypothetical protein
LTALCLIALAACGGTTWVEIIGANADSPDVTVVTIGLGISVTDPASIPLPAVTESSTEVHIRVAIKHDDGDEAPARRGKQSGWRRGSVTVFSSTIERANGSPSRSPREGAGRGVHIGR